MRNRIGPYQRPAPPKRPLGLGASKVVQTPVVPMHEIEVRAKDLLQGMIEDGRILGIVARKAGRPSVHEAAMTPAERQARRRGIQEALKISDATGKPRVESESGGWSSSKCDVSIYADEGWSPTTGGGKKVNPCPTADDGKSHKVHVRGLEIGDEDSNRRLFAENELKKMVGEYFKSPTVNPSAQWIARHVSGMAIQQHSSLSLTLTCEVCGDVMESLGEAADHLRVRHRALICEWFKRLNPPREFRDMGSHVSVVLPRKRKSVQNHVISIGG